MAGWPISSLESFIAARERKVGGGREEDIGWSGQLFAASRGLLLYYVPNFTYMLSSLLVAAEMIYLSASL